MSRIYINGKFLGAGLNGVHRTAAHYSSLLLEHAQSNAREAVLLSPKKVAVDPSFPLLDPVVRTGRFGAGQGWEMLTLPSLARGGLLVNFCNLGPILHRNSVVMIHDAQTFLYPQDYSGRQARAYRALLPVIGRAARRVLTVSDFSRGSLDEHRVARRDKIGVVHNGTDHIGHTQSDPAILQTLGIQDTPFVMVLGSTKGYKNIARVFDAVRKGGLDIPLVVAGGPGADAYASKGFTIPEGTRFTGFVSDNALRALYEAAAVFAFPSQTEGFGLPPIEAMHCGTPVIAARAGAMPEVCGDGAILVDPDATEPWIEALQRVLSDQDTRATLTKHGYARARELSWESAGRQLWSEISALL